MAGYVALLRAINVGGTGALPMSVLVELCQSAGFDSVRTYIASGNAVFRSDAPEPDVRAALEERLERYAGKPVGVLVRTAAEMAEVVAQNPFADQPANRVAALFVDGPLPKDPLDGVKGLNDEQIRLGPRAFYVFYPSGMGKSRLRIPSEAHGTARNMNTVTTLAEMVAAVG